MAGKVCSAGSSPHAGHEALARAAFASSRPLGDGSASAKAANCVPGATSNSRRLEDRDDGRLHGRNPRRRTLTDVSLFRAQSGEPGASKAVCVALLKWKRTRLQSSHTGKITRRGRRARDFGRDNLIAVLFRGAARLLIDLLQGRAERSPRELHIREAVGTSAMSRRSDSRVKSRGVSALVAPLPFAAMA